MFTKQKTIKKDNDSNGFYYKSQGAIYGDIYRNDPEAVAKLEEKKRAEEEAKKAKELAEKAEREKAYHHHQVVKSPAGY